MRIIDKNDDGQNKPETILETGDFIYVELKNGATARLTIEEDSISVAGVIYRQYLVVPEASNKVRVTLI